MGAFLLTLLAVVGFLQLVLYVVAVAAVAAGIAAAALLVRRHGGYVVDRSGAAVSRARTAGASVAAAARREAPRAVGAASRTGLAARKSVDARLPQLRDGYSRTQSAAGRQLSTVTAHAQRHALSAASFVRAQRDAWPTRTPLVRQREALEANAVGTKLRRDGAYLEAAEQHRVALAFFRELRDRRSEALTLNNLALALDRAGDPEALELFEEAATILGELGDEQREGEVIANLALAFRRRGQEEQSAEVLELALAKLDPDSQAYRKVEGLRRAS